MNGTLSTPTPTSFAPPLSSTVTCPSCGEIVTRRCPTQKTCGDQRCRDWLRWRERRGSVEYRATMRERNEKNYAKRKGGEWVRNPWLKGAPLYGTHLPGGAMGLEISPLFGSIEHRHIRMLHGLVSMLLNLDGHGRPIPDFSLIPWPCDVGWALYVSDPERAACLVKSEHVATFFGRKVHVKFGPLVKLRAPTITKRGRRTLTISTITPVSIRNHKAGRTTTHHSPSSLSLVSTLSNLLASRVGLVIPTEHVKIDMVRAETRPLAVELGGKYETVWGWDGEVEVVTNAVGHWLLAVSALIGLGGRTAVGFGRVRVKEDG